MLDSDRPQFAEAIAALAVAFGKQADRALLAAYWMFLEDIPWPNAKEAVQKAGRTLKFMPSPSELRELSGVVTAKARAVLAWGLVCQAAARVGSYRSVWFEDPLINATVRALGGWPRLLALSGEEFDKWARMEFCRTYELLDGVAAPEECRPLAGLGTMDEEPMRVGCEYVLSDQRLLRLSRQVELSYAQSRYDLTSDELGISSQRLLKRIESVQDGGSPCSHE